MRLLLKDFLRDFTRLNKSCGNARNETHCNAAILFDSTTTHFEKARVAVFREAELNVSWVKARLKHLFFDSIIQTQSGESRAVESRNEANLETAVI